MLLIVIAAAILIGPLVTSEPNTTRLDDKLVGPSISYPFGTDQFGRDQLARIAEGGRRSIGAALVVLIGTTAIGVTIGVLAGVSGRLVDTLLMRAVDVMLSLPSLVLALAVVGILGPGNWNLVLALMVSSWAYYARLSRSYVVMVMKRGDVLAARLAGVARWRVITSHVLPTVVAQIRIVASLDLGGVIVSLAGLSYLGLGTRPPDAEWGTMLAESRLFFTAAPWLLVAPALATIVVVTATNLLGEALRDTASGSSPTVVRRRGYLWRR
ncbi:MAG: ABC transporter permease [Acidimicrobiales bacterium]